jgi:hypothetical protein
LFSGLLLDGGKTPEVKSTEIKLSNHVDTGYQQMFLIDLEKRILSKNVFDRWKEISAVNSDGTSGQDRLQWNEISAQDGKSIVDLDRFLKRKTVTIITNENSKFLDVYNYISYVNALVSKEAKTFFQELVSQSSREFNNAFDTRGPHHYRFVLQALDRSRSLFVIEVTPSTPSSPKMTSALLVAFSAILGALLGGFFVLLRQALLGHRRAQTD